MNNIYKYNSILSKMPNDLCPLQYSWIIYLLLSVMFTVVKLLKDIENILFLHYPGIEFNFKLFIQANSNDLLNWVLCLFVSVTSRPGDKSYRMAQSFQVGIHKIHYNKH